jgi:hypothetical protein
MNMPAILKKAKELGVKCRIGAKKVDLVRAIQTAEGNFPCFATARKFCDQENCAWRADCMAEPKAT